MAVVSDTVEIEIGPQRLKGLLGVPAGAEGMAYGRLPAPKELAIVEGAGHLFEEPGTLDSVQHHATRWFLYHMAGNGGA